MPHHLSAIGMLMRDEKHVDAVPIADAQPSIDAICVRNLLDSPGAIIFFKDLHGKVIRVSVDCARLTGRTPDEMLGLSDFELEPIDHAHGSELFADEQRIIATGE